MLPQIFRPPTCNNNYQRRPKPSNHNPAALRTFVTFPIQFPPQSQEYSKGRLPKTRKNPRWNPVCLPLPRVRQQPLPAMYRPAPQGLQSTRILVSAIPVGFPSIDAAPFNVTTLPILTSFKGPAFVVMENWYHEMSFWIGIYKIDGK